jgi:chromosome segregation protein
MTPALDGRHAVVTGGGRGIGAAIATVLAAGGARVTLTGRNEARLKEKAATLPVGRAVRCDVAQEAAVAAAFAEATRAFGPVAILVNNAGAAESAPFLRSSLELFRRMLDVNLIGTFLCARAALPGMLEAGFGRIVNVASIAGLKGAPYVSAYCAAKHGVIGLTRALALETATRGITVNAVCPSYTDTEMARRAIANIVTKTGRSAAEAEAELDAAAHRAGQARLKTKELRQEAKEAHAELDRTRDRIAAAEHAAQASSKALGALAEALSRTRTALDEDKAKGDQLSSALLGLAAVAELEAALEAAQVKAASSRQAAARADAALEGFEREVHLRQERLEAIGDEEGLWQKRIANAREQILTLRAREEETSADLVALANLPAEIEQRRTKLLDAIGAAERERARAADDLALAEAALKTQERALREVQERLAEARETRARNEARLEAARERRSELARAIRDQLDCTPEACLALAGLKPGAAVPPVTEVEARLIKLKGDRERLGGVNLRAEEEEAELAAQLETMEREKADVEEAIRRLRQGIANLNREGRKRLLEAFDTVNGHFGRLFKTLFGGGSAELKLVDSDDPLESGLEIFACPPGKRPQALTLLSGGEKALTALALIFAVFLTNPSPICVLDEVDAPLDDANVERFCLLMEEMAKETDTRFLIITHHPLTMSRMSRLFGVTMAERGVSQLVSVDLEGAVRLRDAS